MRAQVRPARTGRGIDATTGAPVQNALVMVESWEVPTPPYYSYERELLHTIETRTNAQGLWSVPQEKDWKLAILAADGFPVFLDSACAVADGYEVRTINPWENETALCGRGQRCGREIFEKKMPAVIELRPAPSPRSLVRTTNASRCGKPFHPFK